MKLKLTVLTVLTLGGCATGIVQTDDNTYTMSKTSAAGIFTTGEAVLADLYVDANKFCNDRGMGVQTITTDAKTAIPFARTSHATLNFRCAPHAPAASTVTSAAPAASAAANR